MIEKNQVIGAFWWKMLERVCSQGVNLFVQIVLARILLPEDFGSLAIMLAIINYANIFVQSGLSTALIQKINLDDQDIRTVFTASLVIAGILYAALFLASPFIASYYILEDIVWPIRVLALILFLNSICAVQTAILSRNMKFRQIFYRSIIAVPVSGAIGIGMAYGGFGLWALVGYTLSNMALTCLIMSIASGYQLRFGFNKQKAIELYSFSIKIIFTSIVCGFSDTIRTLIIGKKYNNTDLAYYDKAYSYSNYFTQIINTSLSSVLLPTFSRSQDNIDCIRAMARRSIGLTCFLVIPMLTIIASISEPFVRLLLTDKWLPCVPFLTLFCFLRIPGCVISIDKQVYYALGNSKINLYYELLLLVANVCMLFITVPMGIFEIAIGYLIIETLGCISLFLVSAKYYGYTIWQRICDVWKPIVNSLVLYVILMHPVWKTESLFLMMVEKIAAGAIIYILLSIIEHDQNISYIKATAKSIIRKNVINF